MFVTLQANHRIIKTEKKILSYGSKKESKLVHARPLLDIILQITIGIPAFNGYVQLYI
jgi:hypothetical protein